MACLAVWLAGEAAAVITRGTWPPVPVSAAVGLAVRLAADPSKPASAWPIKDRNLIPGPLAYYAILAPACALGAWVGLFIRRLVTAAVSYVSSDGDAPDLAGRALFSYWLPHSPDRAPRYRSAWAGKVRGAQRGSSPAHVEGVRSSSERRDASRTGGLGSWTARLGWIRWARGTARQRGAQWARGTARQRGAQWARGRDLQALRVRGPSAGRVVLGQSGRDLLAVESHHSVLVVGPTQTYKTSGFAIPAILEWHGPVVAVSVKGDLMRDTVQWRRSVGDVWIYDPGSSLAPGDGAPGDGHPEDCAAGDCAAEGASREGGPLVRAVWSPLAGSRTWLGARQVAARLSAAAARQDAPGVTDSTFWYTTASKLLAPMFFAAACSGRDMRDVVRWVDTREVAEVLDALAPIGVPEALQAAHASWDRDDRQLSSVYTTAETILSVFADSAFPASSASSAQRGCNGALDVQLINPRLLCDGGSRTLYVCSPAHEQRHFQLLFVALLEEVLQAAFSISNSRGMPLDPPLLIVLDEAAHVAPLPDLDELASTAASHGVQLITVWQDMSQLAARYGARASTVMNNHRAKIFLSGISDPATLEHTSQLIGDEELTLASTTWGDAGSVSTTLHPTSRRLLPGDALRRMPPGHGILLYGHLPPVHIGLRPWFDDQQLCSRHGSCEPTRVAQTR